MKRIVIFIPFLSVAVDGWQLASRAFARYHKRDRTKQQWKSFFGALIYPRFAARWFEMLKSPDLLLVCKYRQQLYRKPFRVYMSIRWNKKQKVKVILDTHRFIMGNGEAFKEVITSKNGVEIARFKLNDTIAGTLVLGYDDKYRKEGELVLRFNCDQLGGMIAAAAFSFEEIEGGCWVCRIGCVQGHATNLDNSSKAAQKLLHGLRPKSLIVFTLQELSRHLGFTAVYGAGDSVQAYRGKHLVHLPWRHAIQFDYNAIWSESSGQPDSDGWYKIPLTPVRKSDHDIKANKRSLYHRRYCMLDNLSLKIADAASQLSHDGFHRKKNNLRYEHSRADSMWKTVH